MKHIRLRLTTAGVVLITLILAIAFSILGVLFSRFGEENIRQSIHAFSRPVIVASARSLFNPLYNMNAVEMESILSQYVDGQTIIFAAVYNKSGRRITEVSGGWSPDTQLSAELARRAVAGNTQVEQEVGDYLLLANPIGTGEQVLGAVEFVFDQKRLYESFGSNQSRILYFTIAVMLGTALLFFFVIRIALTPLSNLALSAQKIEEGNLDTPIPIRGAYEIALLAEQLETMRKELLKGYNSLHEVLAGLEKRVTERTAIAESARAEAESARENLETQFWLAKGQTQMAEVMRGEQTISQLAENIISQLCAYLGATSGALFLVSGTSLSLTGRYAFADREGFNGQLQFGEGLVGQAAVDGHLLILDGIDSGARMISTGLIDVKPHNVLAFPFYANNKVVGVIELASLCAFNQNHLELLNRLSETIGTGFLTVQTRQRLMDLLAESQRQAREALSYGKDV